MYGVVIKNEDREAVMEARKEFYLQGKHKRFFRRVRKTVRKINYILIF